VPERFYENELTISSHAYNFTTGTRFDAYDNISSAIITS